MKTRALGSRRPLSFRFWAEAVAGVATAVLSVVTAVWPDWIELLFHIDPDNHDGSVEWLIVGLLLMASLALGASARRTWTRCSVKAATTP